MILARVIGQAVSTVKRPQFEGATLLLVQPETPEGVAVGTMAGGRRTCPSTQAGNMVKAAC